MMAEPRYFSEINQENAREVVLYTLSAETTPHQWSTHPFRIGSSLLYTPAGRHPEAQHLANEPFSIGDIFKSVLGDFPDRTALLRETVEIILPEAPTLQRRGVLGPYGFFTLLNFLGECRSITPSAGEVLRYWIREGTFRASFATPWETQPEEADSLPLVEIYPTLLCAYAVQQRGESPPFWKERIREAPWPGLLGLGICNADEARKYVSLGNVPLEQWEIEDALMERDLEWPS